MGTKMGIGLSQLAWFAWWGVTLGLAVWLGYRYAFGDHRVFLPGTTTDGHHQIEMACDACHAPDGGIDEQGCLDCHQTYLADVKDSHPKKKFRDVRKAHLLEKIDAMQCITCHSEHAHKRTHEMGVSIQGDFCIHCHQDITTERETHQGLDHLGCATAGCHNYHDNTALYYEFLDRHQNQPAFADKADAKVPLRQLTAHPPAAAATKPDGPAASSQDIINDWLASRHAMAGVNCSSCHEQADGTWQDTVSYTTCASCHDNEADGWLAGKHGMRQAQGLTPMTPAMARLPMHAGAAHKQLDCSSCHGGHKFDTQFAAVDACMQCHDDAHSRNYAQSQHAATWRDELLGKAPAGSGVSCATCHMPRVEHTVDGGKTVVRVEHNQNRYFQPNEGMLRTSCLHCHGMSFALDALGDPSVIESNFQHGSEKHIPSLEWIQQHQESVKKR